MFSTGWRRYFTHYGRRLRYGLRDAFITLIIYASIFSLVDEIGRFLDKASGNGTVVSDTGMALLLLGGFVIVMALLFTAIDAWMICNHEQAMFRERMGFKDADR